MKTVIIPTDFSPAARNAMHWGVQLAQYIRASVLLVHVYQVPVSMNDIPVSLVSAEELRTNAEDHLKRYAEEMQKAYPESSIKWESRLGDIKEELNDLCDSVKPFALIMGAQGSKGVERFLFGSTTLSFIRHAHYPIIAVPAGFNEFRIKKIVLATDLEEKEKFPVETVIEVAQQLNAALHIVHVSDSKESTLHQPAALLNHLQSLQPVYQTIQNNDVQTGLFNYLNSIQADMLLMFPHEHTLLERLFYKLHAEDLVSHAPIPVMAIRY